MRITPLISADIIGRYTKRNNSIVDNFTMKVIHTKTPDKMLNKLNKIGMLNAQRLQNKQQMLSIIV